MSLKTISIKGQGSWEFDDATLTLKDAFAIKAATGLALGPFLEGLGDLDPDCWQTMIWLLRSRIEGVVNRQGIDFLIADLDFVETVAADPTSGSLTPSSAASGISTSSRAGATSARGKSTR